MKGRKDKERKKEKEGKRQRKGERKKKEGKGKDRREGQRERGRKGEGGIGQTKNASLGPGLSWCTLSNPYPPSDHQPVPEHCSIHFSTWSPPSAGGSMPPGDGQIQDGSSRPWGARAAR